MANAALNESRILEIRALGLPRANTYRQHASSCLSKPMSAGQMLSLYRFVFVSVVLAVFTMYTWNVSAFEELPKTYSCECENGMRLDFELDDYGAVISQIPVRTKGSVFIPSSVTWTWIDDVVITNLIMEDDYWWEDYVHEAIERTDTDYVVDVDPKAFRGCKYVTAFEVEDGNLCFQTRDGILYDWDMTILVRCPPAYQGSLVIPDSVTDIAEEAFEGCEGLTDVIFPSRLVSVGRNAFLGCRKLSSIRVPSSVMSIDEGAFAACMNLTNVVFDGDAPDIRGWELVRARDEFGRELYYGEDYNGDVCAIGVMGSIYIFDYIGCEVESTIWDESLPVMKKRASYDCGYSIYTSRDDDPRQRTSPSLMTHVNRGSFGWSCQQIVSTNANDSGKGNSCLTELPSTWCGRRISYMDEIDGNAGTPNIEGQSVNLTITNVVIHYVCNSISPTVAAPVNMTTGLINIITEVKSGGVVAVPESWANNYPEFREKFGNDFTKALMKETGKYDGSGNRMLVWQDYVVGTDPTDVNDQFRASITMVDGSPVVSWTPELPEPQANLRSYIIYGKTSIYDNDWAVVVRGHESEYNFFKVVVEMK